MPRISINTLFGARINMDDSQIQALALRICDAFKTIEADVEDVSRPLLPLEVELARKVGVQDPTRVRLSLWSEWPVSSQTTLQEAASILFADGDAVQGFAFDHFVVLRSSDFDATLLAHELRHVAQWEQYETLLAYMKEYVGQVVQNGYHQALLERDARAYEIFGK